MPIKKKRVRKRVKRDPSENNGKVHKRKATSPNKKVITLLVSMTWLMFAAMAGLLLWYGLERAIFDPYSDDHSLAFLAIAFALVALCLIGIEQYIKYIFKRRNRHGR